MSDIQSDKLVKKVITKYSEGNVNQTFVYVLAEQGVKQGDLLSSVTQARRKREAPSDASSKTMTNIIVDFTKTG